MTGVNALGPLIFCQDKDVSAGRAGTG